MAEVKQKTQTSRSAVNDHLKKFGAVYAFLLLIIINTISNKNFLTVNTMWNLLIQAFPIIITSLGMLFVISSGGIDVSVGSVMALAGVVNAVIMNGIYPTFPKSVFLGITMGIIVCLLFGLFNGFMISVFKMQPIIVTLTTYIIARGLTQLLANGKILSFSNTPFSEVGIMRLPGNVPIQFAVEIGFVLITAFIIKKMVFGYQVQAIGENPQAAKLCGIKTTKVQIMVYMISAFIAAIAGLLVSSRTSAADPTNLGQLAEMDAIAAVAIGGTSMSGGKSRILTTIISAMIIQLITITINMNNIHYAYARVMKGLIIIIAVYIQQEKKR
ncbi:MAG: ABC transporter permease [Lachnospiraceae bacterium]|nr:ABC transporter permease [Lachnospiraceae bacterium]MBR4993352.1 ABC transporter permease [Lachnospiraceae bacterium]